MSEYVLSDEFFDQLAEELTTRSFSDSGMYFIPEFTKAPRTYDIEEIETSVRSVVNALREANYEAVNSRYDENTAPEILIFSNYPTEWASWSDIQLLKNLQCLRYQMSEGFVPESEIYKRLETLINDLAVYIVGKTAEYDKAEWGG